MSDTRAARRREKENAIEPSVVVILNKQVFDTKVKFVMAANYLGNMVSNHGLLNRYKWQIQAPDIGTEKHSNTFESKAHSMRLMVDANLPSEHREAANNLFNVYSGIVNETMVAMQVEGVL